MTAPVFGPPFPEKRNAASGQGSGARENGISNVPLNSTNQSASLQPWHGDELRPLRRQRWIERICALRSARVWFEFVEGLDRDHGLGVDLDRQLERFADLDPEVLRALGADRFPPRPFRLVGGGQ